MHGRPSCLHEYITIEECRVSLPNELRGLLIQISSINSGGKWKNNAGPVSYLISIAYLEVLMLMVSLACSV